MIYPQSPSEVPQAENVLLEVAKEVNDYWQPIKTWTTISLTMSQNGLTLFAVSITLLFALLIYKEFLNLKGKSSSLKLYGKLPKQNQMIVKAVANAQKKGNPTTEGIANELEKLTNAKIDRASFYEDLQHVENDGLIEKVLTNREDRASIFWRSRLRTKRVFFNFPKNIGWKRLALLWK